LIALAFALTTHVLDRQTGVTEANVKRIRTGMSLHEVQAVLGYAGTDLNDEEEFESEEQFEECVEHIENLLDIPLGSTLRPGVYLIGSTWRRGEIDWDGLSIREWKGPSGIARVLFRHQQVLLAGFIPSSASRPTLLQQVRSYFGR
jgi:hypothetical protein